MRAGLVPRLLLTSFGLTCLLACSDRSPPEDAPPTAFVVRESGSGPNTMVFIPGLSSPGAVWDDTVAHFQPQNHCLVLSLAGFAGVPPAPPDAGASSLIGRVREQLAAHLRARRIAGAVIVGHSLGGIIALHLAASAPELVGGLVIVDALPFLPAALAPGATAQSSEPQAAILRASLAQQSPEQYRQFVSASRLDQLVTDPTHVERITGWALTSDPATVGQAMYDVFVTDLRPELARVRAPTQVIATWTGMKDITTRAATEQTFREQYRLLAEAAIVVTDEARHFVMLDRPQWLWSQLDALLARRRPP